MDALVRRADAFEWEVGSTPISRPSLVGYIIVAYLASVWCITKLPPKTKDAVKSSRVFSLFVSAHSLLLCVGSLGLFVGGLASCYCEYRRVKSLGWLVCREVVGGTASGQIFYVSYWYYLSKYVELLDTVILAVKGKGLSFLHVFHHAVMPAMCWLWLQQMQSLQEIALMTNTLIHVIMYYYYFECSRGRSPRWKKLVTLSQIIQFVFSFGMGAAYLVVRLSRRQACSGEGSLLMNVLINAVFLALFTQFYNNKGNYAARKSRAGKKAE